MTISALLKFSLSRYTQQIATHISDLLKPKHVKILSLKYEKLKSVKLR